MRKPILLAMLVWGALPVSSTLAQKPILPWEDHFGSTTLGPRWTRVVSPGSSLSVKNGGIEIEAAATGRSHVQAPAAGDLITLSGRLTRWASLYLVWDADNWCGVGLVSPTPFGRFYSTAVVDGKADEADHRGIDFGLSHRLRVRLGGNYVRFESGDEGTKWTELRTIARPKGFTGAPKLIAAGKSYVIADKPFAEQGGAANPVKEGTKVVGRISELRVEATPESEANLSAAELKALHEPKVEPVFALLTQSRNDPTFDRVSAHYPPMRSPREVVGVPAHPLDIGVDRLGRLDVSPWTPPLAWFEVGDPPVPLGREGVPFKRRLLHGYLPVLTLITDRDGVEYELSVFGWSEGFRTDKDLIAYVGLTARSTGGSASPHQAALVWGNGNRRAFAMETGRDGRSRGFLRFQYPRPDSTTATSRDEFETKAREAASFWEKRLAPGGRFDIPDPRVDEAYRAWLVYSMLNADTVNGFVEPHDGAGFYEEMFGCSVSLHARALDLYGFHDYAARILDAQLHFQQPDGLYTQACGLTDPGSLLVALARHYEVTGDADWLRRVSPNIVKLCNWMTRQRGAAPKTGPLRGLIKFRPYNDFAEPVFNYLGNAWCARGMADAGAALKAIGTSEAAEINAEAAAYRKDVLDSMEAMAFTDKGQTILPMEPDTHRLLKMSKYRGGDYYGLVASSLLETEFLAPDDKRAKWIVDMIEKRGGLIAGVCEFQGGIDHAYTYGYLMNALSHDDVRKVLLGFWSMMAFGMTRDTYSPVEITQITTGENHFTLPHLYSCTDQLRLLRNLLLREEGDVLWLGKSIPRAWLEAGKHVGVDAAPSEFGDVSYRIDSEADGSMRVRIDPPTRRPPSEIRLRLRPPSGRPIASVDSTPGVTFNVSGETVVFQTPKVPVDLRVRFKAD